MNTRRSAKHKVVFEDEKEVTRTKAICLTDYVKLTNAIDSGDFLEVRNILENKDHKLSRLSLHKALLKAVNEGKKQIVQQLLCHGVCVDGSSEKGCTPLIAAAKHGYLDIVKLLIRKGAPVNGKDSSGKTALMAAVEKNCCSVLISYLLNDCKADLNLQDNKGKTALMLAVEQWDYETIQIFFSDFEDDIEYDCDENIKDKNGHTALDLAKMNGSADLLNVLSEGRKKSMSPLSVAAGRNNFDLVRKLVEVYPSCVESLDFGEAPLTAAIHGLDGDQEVWDGKIHCSFELMNFLLQAGVDVNDCHLCGHTPLMFAASAGSDRAVKMLLFHGASVNEVAYEVTGYGLLKRQTALMMAAYKGWTSIVEKLIQAGSDLNMKDADGENALCLAIKGGKKSCVHVLLKQWQVLTNHDIELMHEHKLLNTLTDVKDRWSELLKDPKLLQKTLCKSIQAGSFDLVKALIAYGADVNFFEEDDLTDSLCPLMSALDDADMLAILLNMGADINVRLEFSNYTALMEAASIGNETGVRNLLKYNADMYAESHGINVLILAIRRSEMGILMALLDEGMDINHVSKGEKTALWYALTMSRYELLDTLVKHGANVNFASTGGVTVLMQAIRKCTTSFLELIIKSGADVNAQDDKGNTALFYVLESFTEYREEKLSLLLQHGANVNHVNLSLKTPLMKATKHYHIEGNVINILLASKPEMNTQDMNGNTALHFAVLCSDEEKMKLLLRNGADAKLVNVEHRNPLMEAFKTLKSRLVKVLLNHGARVNIQSSPDVNFTWRSDLNRLFKRFNSNSFSCDQRYDFINCVEDFMETGCALQEAQPFILNKFLTHSINADELRLVTLLVKSGVGPNKMDLCFFPEWFRSDFIHIASLMCKFGVSPMCTAILQKRPKIVALFAQTCFYDSMDVKMLQHPLIKMRLKDLFLKWPQKDSSALENLCPNNWSLRTWSKLAVQNAVGYGEGREQRMRALPIPDGIRDELLYKNIHLPCKTNMS
ncbi:hypothetical protein RRG08_036965 [Elysia crispata]|uniref:Uncharacterized protein n=1 Tax=Elysia crispata TaxID=231223 RepID=A0AAE0XU13_9GAST|nr:hypothetical protein RRG08_036965 [Elysia crispata]